MIFIYTVCQNKTAAKKIANMLLRLKLIACANWWPIASVYRWNDKVINDKEVALILKTRKNYYKKVETVIKKIHRYETPCICRISIDQVEKKYRDWLIKETRIV